MEFTEKEGLSQGRLRKSPGGIVLRILCHYRSLAGNKMVCALTYPGVFIEEIPRILRTIVGVAPSIDAHICQVICGTANKPGSINSFGDLKKEFKRPWREGSPGFVVPDFFINGGSQTAIAYTVSRCRNHEIRIQADPDITANRVLIQNMMPEYEGWKCCCEVQQPAEQPFTEAQ